MNNKPSFCDYIRSPMKFGRQNICKSLSDNNTYREKNLITLRLIFGAVNIIIPIIIFLIVYIAGEYSGMFRKIVYVGLIIYFLNNFVFYPLRYPLINFEVIQDCKKENNLIINIYTAVTYLVFLVGMLCTKNYINLLENIILFG